MAVPTLACQLTSMELIVMFEFFQCGRYNNVDSVHLPPELMALCRERWPQFFPKSKEIMRVELRDGDPLIEEVILFFGDQGRKAVWNRFPGVPYGHPTNFQVRGIRRFDLADVESAQFLRGYPERVIFQGGMRNLDGTTEVVRRFVKAISFGQSDAATPVCTSDFRCKLEEESFSGLTFRKVFVKTRSGEGQSLWELWSDRLMPPMKNTRVDEDGEPFDIPRRKGCLEADFFQPPLLRFDRDDVERLAPFDFALTRESFGPAIGKYGEGDGSKLLDPYLIVSQRFRAWCEVRKIKFKWFPIALES